MFIITLLIETFSLSAEYRSSVAVLPLRTLGDVSVEEAETLTMLLEIGIVKSSSFQVVEKNEIARVMDAQKFSSEAFADESNAVELGKILSAQHIVIGTVSNISNRFYLFAKVIDVTLGSTIRAEKLEADSITKLLQNAVELGQTLSSKMNLSSSPEIAVSALSVADSEEKNRRLTISGGILLGIGGLTTSGMIVSLVNYSLVPGPPWDSASIALGIVSGIVSTIGALLLLERS